MSSAMPPAGASRPLRERLVRGGGWAFLGRLLILPVGFFQTVLLARLLSPADLGTYFLAMSLIGVLVILAQVGMGRTMVRLVASALATERPAAARHAIRVALAVTATMGGLAALALADGPGRWLAGLLEGGDQLGGVLTAVAMLALALTLVDLFAEIFRGLHDIRAASLFGDQLLHRIGLASLLLCVWLIALPVDLDRVLTLAVGSAWGVLILGVVVLRTRVARLGRHGEPWRWRTILAPGPPFLLVRLNLWFVAGADLWILGMFRPPAEVALYGAASRLALFAGTSLTVANAVLAPTVAELHSRGQRHQLERVIRAAATLSALAASTLVVIYVLFGATLLELVFSDAYTAGHGVVAILAIGHGLNASLGSSGICLTMSGHERLVMFVSIVVGVVTLGGFLVVAGPYGALGIAVVTVGSRVAHKGVLALMAWRYLRIRTWPTASPAALVRLVMELRAILQRRR